MEPLIRQTLDAAVIDALFSEHELFLLDSAMTLHRLGENEQSFKSKPLLKTPPSGPLPFWSGKLLEGGQALLLDKTELRRFSFVAATGQKRVPLSPYGVRLGARSQDANLLAVADESGFISVFSLQKNRLYSLCPKVLRRCSALFFCPEGRWLFAANSDGEALIYDLLAHRIALELHLPKPVDGGLFLEGGRLLLTGVQRDLFFYSWHGGGVLLSHLSLLKVRPQALIAKGEHLLVGLESGGIAAIETKNRQLLRLWPLLNEPVSLLRQSGDRIVACGSRGAVALFDSVAKLDAVEPLLAKEDYAGVRQAVAKDGFLLLQPAIGAFFENSWREKVFPKILSQLEQGQTELAKELAEPFMDDPQKARQFGHALSLAEQMRALREAVKTRHYDVADELIAQHPFLRKSISGQLYLQSWANAYEEALAFLSKEDKADAKKALEHFLPVKGKADAIGHLFHFAPLFVKAGALLEKEQIQAYFELVETHPILKGMPQYDALIVKGQALRNRMLECAERHDYREELECAKALAKYAPYALEAKKETEHIRLEALFHDAIRKDRYADAFELAQKYPFLADEKAFALLYAPYQKRFTHALEAAERGDGEGVYTLMAESVKNPLLKDGVALLFRIAYTERFRHVTVSGAVDWTVSFELYTRLLGCDPLIMQAAKELGEEKALDPFLGRTHLQGYERSGFVPEIIRFKPMDHLAEKSRLPMLQAIAVLVFVVIAGFLLMLANNLMEQPLEEYREKTNRESPYKLFENLAKRGGQTQD